MKRFIGLLCLLLAPSAWATTAVTGHLQTLGTGNVTSGAFVRFWLRGCSGNQPTVSGTALIAPSQGGVFFFDISADGSGNVTGTLYSTRDSTGLLGGDISCGGSTLAVWYGMQVFVAGKGGPEVPIHAKNGVTLDITSVTPITTSPVITSPTGDTTYVRLDGTNGPGTGNLTFKKIENIRYAEQFATVQAAINDLPSTGGWVLVPPGTYTGPTTIPSHVRITGYVPGITAATITAATNLVWGTPPSDQKTIFTYTANLTISGLWDTTIEGVTMDFGGGNFGVVLQNGIFNNSFDMTIQNCGTGACMTWNGGSVAGQSVVGNRFRLNVFNAGKAIRMTATAPGVAANNTVYDYVFNNISSIAIECVQQADTNTFRNGFLYGLGNNATGVLINSATPAVDSGCNDNKFLDITTDVLNGGGAYVGTLVQINKSNGTVVNPWSIGGSTNSGTELATTGSPSATICTASDFSVASNSNWCRYLGPTQYGTGGSSINKIFLVSGTLTYTAIATQACQEQALAVTGATANTGVWSASPNPGLGNVNLSWSAHADAIANSVLVRVCNPTVGAITPTAVSWTVSGMQ